MPSPLTAASPQPALHSLWGKDGLGACTTWYCHLAAGGVVWNLPDPWGCPGPGLVSPVGPANVAAPGGTAAALARLCAGSCEPRTVAQLSDQLPELSQGPVCVANQSPVLADPVSISPVTAPQRGPWPQWRGLPSQGHDRAGLDPSPDLPLPLPPFPGWALPAPPGVGTEESPSLGHLQVSVLMSLLLTAHTTQSPQGMSGSPAPIPAASAPLEALGSGSPGLAFLGCPQGRGGWASICNCLLLS